VTGRIACYLLDNVVSVMRCWRIWRIETGQGELQDPTWNFQKGTKEVAKTPPMYRVTIN